MQHRAKFRPNKFADFRLSSPEASIEPDHRPTDTPNDLGSSGNPYYSNNVQVKETGKSFVPDLKEREISQDILEVWFAGCHGGLSHFTTISFALLNIFLDVGGGSVSNETSASLSNISLRWMVHEVISSGCGILFDAEALKHVKIEDNPKASSEEVEMDTRDALEPKHSAFRRRPLWWLLEILPLRYSYQGSDGIWHRHVR